MKTILFLITWSILSATSQAATPWTNEARAPSKSKSRGYQTIDTLLSQLEVNDCAREQLTPHIFTGLAAQPLMVANTTIWTWDKEFEPEMAMTFRENEVDHVTRVVPALDSPIVAEVYSARCNNQNTYIAYMPKCENLAKLTPVLPAAPTVLPHNRDRRGRGGTGPNDQTVTTHSISLPGTLILVGAGFILLWYYRGRKHD